MTGVEGYRVSVKVVRPCQALSFFATSNDWNSR